MSDSIERKSENIGMGVSNFIQKQFRRSKYLLANAKKADLKSNETLKQAIIINKWLRFSMSKLQGRIRTLEAELLSYRSAAIQKHYEFTTNQPFKQAHVMPQSILSSIGIV